MSDKTSDKLLNCPFCGGEATLTHYSNKFATWYQVVCMNCHISQNSTYLSEEIAIAEWNQRKPMERIIERLESASWNTQSTFDHDGYCNDDSDCVVSLYDAIKIIEEEGGLND